MWIFWCELSWIFQNRPKRNWCLGQMNHWNFKVSGRVVLLIEFLDVTFAVSLAQKAINGKTGLINWMVCVIGFVRIYGKLLCADSAKFDSARSKYYILHWPICPSANFVKFWTLHIFRYIISQYRNYSQYFDGIMIPHFPSILHFQWGGFCYYR